MEYWNTPKLSNSRLRWFSDNQNVIKILTTGSKRSQLHAISLNIFNVCLHYQVHLEPEWIPRSENEQADYLSRIVDLDDWMLNSQVFVELDARWGPHSYSR